MAHAVFAEPWRSAPAEKGARLCWIGGTVLGLEREPLRARSCVFAQAHVYAYHRDPEAFRGRLDRMQPNIRRAIRFIQGRCGEAVAPEDGADILDQLARGQANSYGLCLNSDIPVARDGAIVEHRIADLDALTGAFALRRVSVALKGDDPNTIGDIAGLPKGGAQGLTNDQLASAMRTAEQRAGLVRPNNQTWGVSRIDFRNRTELANEIRTLSRDGEFSATVQWGEARPVNSAGNPIENVKPRILTMEEFDQAYQTAGRGFADKFYLGEELVTFETHAVSVLGLDRDAAMVNIWDPARGYYPVSLDEFADFFTGSTVALE